MQRIAIVVLFLLVMNASADHRGRRPGDHGRVEDGIVRMPSEMLRTVFAVEPLGCSLASHASCGSTRTGSANSCNSEDYYFDFHSFDGIAGQRLTVNVTTSISSYQILVAIQDFDTGAILASNYGTRGTSTSYTFARTDDYIVAVGFVQKFFSGSYTATLTCTNTGDDDCRVAASLTRGAQVSSVLGPSDVSCSVSGTRAFKLFEFQGEAGEPVRITATSSAFPVYIETASADDDAGAWKTSDSLDPYLIFYPTRTGRQWIWIGNDDGGTSGGNFTIRIDDEPLEACRRRAVRH